MGTKAQFKQIMKDKGFRAEDLAKATGTSVQNIYNTFYKDNVSFANAEKIADALGCDIVFVDRKTGKTY